MVEAVYSLRGLLVKASWFSPAFVSIARSNGVNRVQPIHCCVRSCCWCLASYLDVYLFYYAHVGAMARSCWVQAQAL